MPDSIDFFQSKFVSHQLMLEGIRVCKSENSLEYQDGIYFLRQAQQALVLLASLLQSNDLSPLGLVMYMEYMGSFNTACAQIAYIHHETEI